MTIESIADIPSIINDGQLKTDVEKDLRKTIRELVTKEHRFRQKTACNHFKVFDTAVRWLLLKSFPVL